MWSRTSAGRQIGGGLPRHRILRLDPRDQARPIHRAAIGNRRIDHGHLQRRHRHFALADADVRRVALAPAFVDALQRGHVAAGFLPRGQVKLFAEMKFFRQRHDALRAGLQAGLDEIGIARPLHARA